MAVFFAYLGRILEIALTILGIARIIHGDTENAAQEHLPYAIETIASNAANTVNHPTWGNHQIYLALQAIASYLVTMKADILAAIAALPAGSSLPGPGGYGSDVWGYTAEGELQNMGVHQCRAGALAYNIGRVAQLPGAATPAFLLGMPYWSVPGEFDITDYPSPDWGDLRDGDTRRTWLMRTDAANNWSAPELAGEPWAIAHYTGQNPSASWRCQFSEAQFQSWVAGRYLALHHAPVWPGLENVDLSTPVELAQGTFVDELCDGLLLAISSTERLIPFMTAGSYKLYRNLGRVTFLSDAPSAETWQGIPADVCVLVPKGLAHATGALLSFYTGVTGTVTPWTVKPGGPAP
jgi:hypothetical protein